MDANTSSVLQRSSVSYAEVPIVLKALLVFSVMTVAMDFYFYLFSPSEIREAIIPYTGWSISNTYGFAAIIMYFFLSGQMVKPYFARNGVALILTIGIIFAIVHFLVTFGRDDFGNPYLMVSQWRPVWTILIPTIWLVMLYTPRVNKYCENYRPLVR